MKRLFFFTVIIITINSCTKNSGKQPDNPPDVSLKVKTITYDISQDNSVHTITTSTLFYDDQDRLINVKSDKANINFEYDGNLVKKDIIQTSQPSQHNYYYLNDMSLTDSGIYTIENNPDTSHFLNIYNAKNLLDKQIVTTQTNFGITRDTFFFEYNSRNDFIKGTYKGNINSYEYTDSAGFNNTSLMIDPGQMPSPHLVKTSKFTYNGVDQNTNKYSFKFDNENRIFSETISEVNLLNASNKTEVISYTYY